jgi:tripartite-type tricarboxylate transporter receptor subunit TctC
MPRCRTILPRRALLLAAAALPVPAFAQAPTRTSRIVVGFPAGGPADLASRIVADALAPRLGIPVVVENRTGASGAIASEAVAGAAPDGATLLLSGNHVSIAHALAPTTRYDPVRSFTPVARFAALPSGLFVNAASSAASLDELLAQVRSRPDALTYASGGNGTPSHIAMELLKRRAGFSIRHIPYKGTPPAVTDLIGGQVDMLFTSIAGPMAQVRSGRLRILAVSSPRRLPLLPDVPAIAEKVPGYEFETWLGLAAPRSTPAAAVSRIAAEVAGVMQDPAVLRRLEEAGFAASYQAGPALMDRVTDETELYARTVREAGIRAE